MNRINGGMYQCSKQLAGLPLAKLHDLLQRLINILAATVFPQSRFVVMSCGCMPAASNIIDGCRRRTQVTVWHACTISSKALACPLPAEIA